MIPLRKLFEYLAMMLAEGWGYIWGTAGVLCTQAVIDKAANNPNNPNPEVTEKYGPKWLGKFVSDCSGIIVWIWARFGLKIPHGSNSMVKQGYVRDIGTTPFPGAAAFVYKEDTDDYSHIGIVGADGMTVYEAKGTQSGFVTSKVTDKKWNRFGRFKDVNYGGEEKSELNTPYTAQVVTESGSLNVRSGPGTDYDKVGKIVKGSTVKVITHGSEWDFIDYEYKQGYVSNRYLQPIEEIHDDPVPDPAPDDGMTTLCRSDGIRIQLAGKWEVL